MADPESGEQSSFFFFFIASPFVYGDRGDSGGGVFRGVLTGNKARS